MPWTAAEIGSAISAGGSVLGGLMGGGSADKAAQAQLEATRLGIDEQRRQYDLTRADNAPWMQAGSSTLARLMQGLGLAYGPSTTTTTPSANKPLSIDDYAANNGAVRAPDGSWRKYIAGEDGQGSWASLPDFNGQYTQQNPQEMVTTTTGPQAPDPNDPFTGSLTRKFAQSDMDADPVYQSGLQFGLDQGTKGINARAIASGGYDSGATLKALTQFGNDYASQKGNESFNRYNAQNDSIFNKLSGVSGAGQVATAQVGQAGQNAANNVTQLYSDAGNARAASIVGGQNAFNQGLSGANGAFNNYQNNQILNKIIANRGINGGGGGGGGYGTGGYDYASAMYDVG